MEPNIDPAKPVAWRRIATAPVALVAVCALLAVGAHAAERTTPAGSFDTRPVQARHGKPHLPPHWQHGAFMEIFVRAYQDSDGDGIGDLRGLTQRLDYLRDLGVRGLWLMPVNRSADGDHGYAPTDHRAIEPAYGTLADFDELLRQAHRRGIGVIVDYVINHAASDHPAFVDARANPASRWRDWFVWADEAPQGWDIWGKNPWYATATEPWTFRGHPKDLPPPPPGTRGFYFGTFAQQMPDFDLRHGPARAYHLDSLRFWLNRGLDGFRLDATPHLVENNARDWNDQPESRALTRELQDLIQAYPRRYLVCEATAKPREWADPAVCGGAFAFGYVQHYVQAALGQAESVEELADWSLHATPRMATFLSNHDLFAGQRLWDQVKGDEAAYKLAAAGYLLQPGTPFIYYGEEIGQGGVTSLPGDGSLRAPMSWSDEPRGAGFTTGTPFRPLAPNAATHNVRSQQRRPGSIHAFYKAMLALRNGRASIARGGYGQAFAAGLTLGFQRMLGGERSLVLIHYGTEPAAVEIPGLSSGMRLRPLHPAAEAGARPLRASPGGRLTLALAPRSVQVFALEDRWR